MSCFPVNFVMFAIFVLFVDGVLVGIIGIHVDDFLFAGTSWFLDVFLGKLRRAFLVGKEKMREFEFCGIKIKQHDDFEISIDQHEYAAGLRDLEVEKKRDKEELCSDAELACREHVRLRRLHFTLRCSLRVSPSCV